MPDVAAKLSPSIAGSKPDRAFLAGSINSRLLMARKCDLAGTAGRPPHPMRLLLASLLALCAPGLLAQSPAWPPARVVTTVTKGAPAWKTWKNTACALNHPGTWSVDDSGTDGATVTFLAPPDSSGASPAQVHLAVRGPGPSLADLLTAAAADLHLQDLRVVQDEPFADQHLRELEATRDGRPVRLRQSAWPHGDRTYVLTFIAEAGAYEESRFLAEAMINSFRFL